MEHASGTCATMSSLTPVGFCVVSLYSVELNTLRNYPRTPYIYIILFLASNMHYTEVGSSTIMMVTPGENFISLEWSPPSEGSTLSFTITWIASSVPLSSIHLPPTCRCMVTGSE